MTVKLRFLTAAMLVCSASAALAVDKGKAKYIGGTVASIPEKSEGPIDLKGEDKLVFMPEKGSRLEIPWTSVEELEYGQKVGRRWRTAILVAPIALLSKARKHFVTVSFKDAADKPQAAVFEFDKSDIRQNLAIFRTRCGKEITYQDEEARKQMGGS
jgi:hypothetical protein